LFGFHSHNNKHIFSLAFIIYQISEQNYIAVHGTYTKAPFSQTPEALRWSANMINWKSICMSDFTNQQYDKFCCQDF